MNTQANDVEALEVTIDQAREAINLRDELLDLTNSNKTFKKLIVDGYLKDNVISLTMQKAFPQNESDEAQEQLDHGLRAAAELQAFLNRVIQYGNQMEASMAANEAELDLARNEES